MKQAAVILLALWSAAATALGQTTRPIPAVKQVVIISVDGMRPDLMLRADTPNMHAMMDRGSFTLWARTTAESVTLPSHTSMLTGVVPIKHTIQWNMDLPLTHPVYPAFPTIFELAHQAGYTTAMIAGKTKFINLAKPGTLDWVYIPFSPKAEDPEVAVQAVSVILQHQPQVLFVHFPSVDNAGHMYGWSSKQQLDAIAGADRAIGQILWALNERHATDSTFMIVTADHGGSGLLHGPDDPRSRNIPWLATGPKVRKGIDLTIYPQLTINTEDTFSTVAYVLGIPVLKPVDGQVVREIFDRSNEELMHGADGK